LADMLRRDAVYELPSPLNLKGQGDLGVESRDASKASTSHFVSQHDYVYILEFGQATTLESFLPSTSYYKPDISTGTEETGLSSYLPGSWEVGSPKSGWSRSDATLRMV
jgi:hypothetical protein